VGDRDSNWPCDLLSFSQIKEKIFRLEMRLGDPNTNKMAEYEAKIHELQKKLSESLKASILPSLPL